MSKDLTLLLGTYRSIYAAGKELGISHASSQRKFGLQRLCLN